MDISVYQAAHVLLQFSTSYALAKQGVEPEDCATPPYYPAVIETYRRLGDVHVPFENWWRRSGSQAFNVQPERQMVQALDFYQGGGGPNIGDLITRIQTQAKRHRDAADQPACLILGVPLGYDIEATLTAVRHQILMFEANCWAPLPLQDRVVVKRAPKSEWLKAALPLIFLRCKWPNEELWRLGKAWKENAAEAAKGRTEVAGRLPAAKRVNVRSRIPTGVGGERPMEERKARQILSASVYRDLRKLEALAENAAQGIFFSSTPPYGMAKFDYDAAAKRLRITATGGRIPTC